MSTVEPVVGITSWEPVSDGTGPSFLLIPWGSSGIQLCWWSPPGHHSAWWIFTWLAMYCVLMVGTGLSSINTIHSTSCLSIYIASIQWSTKPHTCLYHVSVYEHISVCSCCSHTSWLCIIILNHASPYHALVPLTTNITQHSSSTIGFLVICLLLVLPLWTSLTDTSSSGNCACSNFLGSIQVATRFFHPMFDRLWKNHGSC